MNAQCLQLRPLIQAYADGELDLVTSLKVEQHLPDCPECAGRLANITAMSAALKDPTLQYKASPALQTKIMNLTGEIAPKPGNRMRIWLYVGAIAAAVLFALGLFLNFRPGAQTDRLIAQAVEDHVRSRLANDISLFQVPSSDSHTVKPWLSARLDFSPPVQDFSQQGFKLAGGRIDILADRNVAALVYLKGNHTINVFVWPAQSTDSTQPEYHSRQGYCVAMWKNGGLNFCAVSDASQSSLETLAGLITQPILPSTLPR